MSSVAAAVADCGLVVATTARDRLQRHRVLDVREAATRIVDESGRGPVAILFGGERAGLANDDLESAHVLLRIPANPAYNSLNVAMAAQLVAYEIHQAALAEALRLPEPALPTARELPLAPAAEMAQLYAHIEAVLEDIDFRDHTQSGTHLMARIRRLFQRAELDQNEVNILRGILTAVQGRRRPAGAPHASRREAP
jgi:TrmH family RNA methyltransferase